MHAPYRKSSPLLKVVNNAVVDLPAPRNLNVWWNFGRLLGLCLILQIVTGVFLAMHYTPDVRMAFSSVVHIRRDVSYGWLLRRIHANGASLLFICIYAHIGRGLYYGSYLYKETWNVGVLLLVLIMATAFLGYVLPWGQMSFWGATVITNLLSRVPYIGGALVEWVWGGFAVNNATLTRFFTLHFLTPFIVAALTLIHLLFLHESGSNNPLGLNGDSRKVPFHRYYTYKDLVGFMILLFALIILVLFAPQFLGDPENWVPADPLVTPVHIQPEWYFLFAYAILRSIPNKLGGVVGLLASVLVLFTLPASSPRKYRGLSFYPLNQALFWGFVGVFLVLTWVGICPVERPYEGIGQLFTCLYFVYFLVDPIVAGKWEEVIEI